MTKLEELEAALDAAKAAARDAYADADAASKAAYYAEVSVDAAWADYQEELNKQQKTVPREPVEDEGNSLV